MDPGTARLIEDVLTKDRPAYDAAARKAMVAQHAKLRAIQLAKARRPVAVTKVAITREQAIANSMNTASSGAKPAVRPAPARPAPAKPAPAKAAPPKPERPSKRDIRATRRAAEAAFTRALGGHA
jgi:hypothetical protein